MNVFDELNNIFRYSYAFWQFLWCGNNGWQLCIENST